MDRTRQEWIMSTQRRVARFSLATKISRLGARLRSWLARWKNRAVGVGDDSQCCSARDLNASTMSPTAQPEVPARVATNSLQTDHRNQQAVRLVNPPDIRLGSPPLDDASVRRSSRQRSPGYPPIHLPANRSRFHRSLPWAPAALCCRTERHDGKRDMHFKHAA